MDADPLADTDPEITLYREPWANGRLRTATLRAPDDARVRVRTEDGRQEFEITGVVHWFEPGRGWLTTLAVAPYDPEAEYVRLELAEEGK